MSYRNGKLCCDMKLDCVAPVTHIDEKGFAYCRNHGTARKAYRRCRQLTPAERKALIAGAAIHYERERNTREFLDAQIAKAHGVAK